MPTNPVTPKDLETVTGGAPDDQKQVQQPPPPDIATQGQPQTPPRNPFTGKGPNKR